MVNISQFRTAYRRGPYAWPGGYPIYAITTDGGALCFKCLETERRSILESLRDNINDGWHVAAFEINWEDTLYCDHCNVQIESAYGEEVRV